LENDSSKNADKIEDGTISIQKQILKQHDFREKRSNNGRERIEERREEREGGFYNC
jgi:hypothetical protein